MRLLLDTLEDFLKVRAFLAISITAVTLFLFASGQSVPTDLVAVNSLVLGHYFGNKSALDDPTKTKKPL